MRVIVDGKTWCLIEVLKEATGFLDANGIENPRLSAEWLLGHALELSRIDLYLQFERPLNKNERDIYKALLRRRAAHEPLQYILGKAEFMSLPFKVTPDVLIPRPETEVLVEKTIEQIKKVFGNETEILCLDIGTGCGNIAISLVKNWENIRILAIDINPKSIEVARENSKINLIDERTDFQVLDVMQSDFVEKLDRKFDVIVSNPPYVMIKEYNNLSDDVVKYEPRFALEAGKDGLIFYRCFANVIPNLLKDPGIALFEIGETQGENVKSIFYSGTDYEIKIFKDYAGRDRVVLLMSKNVEEL